MRHELNESEKAYKKVYNIKSISIQGKPELIEVFGCSRNHIVLHYKNFKSSGTFEHTFRVETFAQILNDLKERHGDNLIITLD